jgi:hypothetical protein
MRADKPDVVKRLNYIEGHLGGWLCAGRARWKARPRPSRSAVRLTAGTRVSPALSYLYVPCRLLGERQGSTSV